MSLLVVYNGQFSPHARTERIHDLVPQITKVRASQEVSEFREVLHDISPGPESKPSAGLNAYQKQEKSFQLEKKFEHARDIMTSPVKVIQEKALATEAKEMLEHFGFRHLPVVNEQKIVVGMISDRETVMPLEKKTCQEIMVKKLIVTDEHTSIKELAITLLEEKINALPVINRQHELIGIVTLTDILKYVIRSTPFLGFS